MSSTLCLGNDGLWLVCNILIGAWAGKYSSFGYCQIYPSFRHPWGNVAPYGIAQVVFESGAPQSFPQPSLDNFCRYKLHVRKNVYINAWFLSVSF